MRASGLFYNITIIVRSLSRLFVVDGRKECRTTPETMLGFLSVYAAVPRSVIPLKLHLNH